MARHPHLLICAVLGIGFAPDTGAAGGGVARPAGVVAVVPRPQTVVAGSGHATFGVPLTVRVAPGIGTSEARGVADYLCEATRGGVVPAAPGAARADVTLEVVQPLPPRLPGPEAYDLDVTPRGIRIRARHADGLFRGVQTLRQLPLAGGRLEAPARRSAEDGATGHSGPVVLPIVSIRDAPRFEWRGAMLDVGRHFLGVEDVERFLDLLALHKMNVLHWHLTEDQGWRIEISRYPRLTAVGGWRTEADGTRYGGFYTKADIRRVVDYARRRHITIVPEIEMPGHSSAALAAYPELGCTGVPQDVPASWGVFSGVYCPGRDATFAFLRNVLDEVIDLFPSTVIHIGGDEVPKDHWKACARCQDRIRAEGLKDESALQSYFIRRIATYLASKGRELTGWDEILEGGLAPGATVQVWRDTEHIRTAVRLGSRVIASPTSHAYINRSPAELPLRTAFEFDPVPPGLTREEAARVRGGEATLWSEQIDAANLDQMAFPRLSAIAEVLWAGPGGDFQEFKERLDGALLPRLREFGVSPGPEDRALFSVVPFFDAGRSEAGVRVSGAVEGLEARYSTDGTRPTVASPLLRDVTRFSQPGVVEVQPFIKGRPALGGRTVRIERHQGVGARVAMGVPNSASYPGTGPLTLTDGLRGSLDFHDGLWQGWEGVDADVTIDLGGARTIEGIEVGALQVMRSWILLPRAVACAVSDDGATWRALGEVRHDVPAARDRPELHRFDCQVPSGTRARFVRVRAENAGQLPDWHPGAGGRAWVFLDEVVVR